MVTAILAAVVLLMLLAAGATLRVRRTAPVATVAGLAAGPPMPTRFVARLDSARSEWPRPNGPCRVTGLSKHEAEDLLDWLEATGHAGRELSYAEGSGFTVSWH